MCGIAAALAPAGGAATLVYRSLQQLQHRGHESAGIAVLRGGRLLVRHEAGLLDWRLRVWSAAQDDGTVAVGHVRYSTSGHKGAVDAQPVVVGEGAGGLALVHNGTITDPHTLSPGPRADRTVSDTELLACFLVHPSRRDHSTLAAALASVAGAFSLALLRHGELCLVRDPHGFRPLFYARRAGGWLAASETCALEALPCQDVREVAAGEMVRLAPGRARAQRFGDAAPGFCALELIYLSRPESVHGGTRVGELRRSLGRMTARQAPARADLVVGVPTSGLDAAAGYAEESGLPVSEALRAHPATPRSFIQPTTWARRRVVEGKFEVSGAGLGGKSVAVVDDSLVRGTTMRQVCRLLRDAGAARVHVRIASPKVRWPCYFGVDFPDPGELIARTTPLALAGSLGADSVAFLSLGQLEAALAGAGEGAHCVGCFSGGYPAPLPSAGAVERLPLVDATGGTTR